MKGLYERYDVNGYYGAVHYSDGDQVFYGKIMYIKDLVSYEGIDVQSLRKAFEEAVDDYLELCRDQRRDPDKPFKGNFNVRVDPDLHRRVAFAASNQGIALNRFVIKALEKPTSQNIVT